MKLLCSLFLCCISVFGFAQEKGDYMGEIPPGNVPKKFMPNEVSKKDMTDFGSVFSKDGKAFFYATEPEGRPVIKFTQQIDGQWTPFKVVLSHPRYGFNDPFLSNDEQRLYYISQLPKDDRDVPRNHDIWYSELKGNSWSAPINAGPQINSDKNEYYMSFTHDGSMYFSSNKEASQRNDFNIYRAQANNQGWNEAVKLSTAINTDGYEADVFVAPDESYIIFSARGRSDSFGSIDLYISFRKEDGAWDTAKNMGAEINGRGPEYCPFVTKDGKYLFYTKNNDIYWVSTDVLKR